MRNQNDFCTLKYFCQINVFLNRLSGQSIGVSMLGIFVINKNTILAVSYTFTLFYKISSCVRT